eukprot:5826526-Amphidinium_carterae.1
MRWTPLGVFIATPLARVVLVQSQQQWTSQEEPLHNACNWHCLGDDADAIAALDIKGGDLALIWTELRKRLSRHQNCAASVTLLQLVSLLAQANDFDKGEEYASMLKEIMNVATDLVAAPPGCFLPRSLRSQAAQVRPWMLAAFGVFSRFSDLFRTAHGTFASPFPLKVCETKIKYHQKGSEDLFQWSWSSDRATVLPVHRLLAYLELGRLRCPVGTSTTLAAIGRGLLQLVGVALHHQHGVKHRGIQDLIDWCAHEGALLLDFALS